MEIYLNRCLEKPAGRCNFAQNALAMTDDLEPFAFCICCGKPLSAAGRLDRKFCDERCKNRYHNRIRYPKRESRQQEILHILDRNRSILARLVTLGIHSLDRRALQHLGYDTDYITSYKKVGNKHLCSCFDYIYELTPTRIKRIGSVYSEVLTSE